MFRKGEAYLKVTLHKERKGSEVKDGVAFYVSMAKVVVGKDDKQYVRTPTHIGGHHYRSLA
ncbi:hypothetical protein GWK48_10430 [Metallosphaera tengchongensis]|uniref:Transposase n=1 Tax=Metallosphaera tengchongensis TaxID=1532350 RepID=A0A6N0NYY1_9CREN|nr:hypothetical protein [Metallosphaera tengchongensis]QKR00749.1 hypothetical protein GWK48_10430 [Metallosphaera tengchongensis]